jgi:hypothetical protein
MNRTQFETRWLIGLMFIIGAGIVQSLPVFTGTIVPFSVVCLQVATFIALTAMTIRVSRQQRTRKHE